MHCADNLVQNSKPRIENSVDSFLACSDYCHLLITFADRMDADQDEHSVNPDLDPNHFDSVPERIF